MVREKEKMCPTEYFDSEDIEKLMELSKKIVGHEFDPVYQNATVIAILQNSKKTKEREKALLKEVMEEMFDNEKFRWSQDSKMIDWGQYVHFPRWMKVRPRPFPVAWWQLSVSITLMAILYVTVLNYIS